MTKISKTRKIISWCCFDFGISSYHTLILTFFYGAFYTKSIAKNETIGTAYWGFSISIASVLSFLLISYFLIQSKNYLKNIPTYFFKFIFYVMIISVSSLFFFEKGDSYIFPLLFVIISYICLEFVNLFYNISLQKVSPKNKHGIVSNFGWASGYLGGLIALMLVYLLIEFTDDSNFKIYGISIFLLIGPFVGLWSYVFAHFHFSNFKSVKFSIPNVLNLALSFKDKKLRYFLISFFFFNNGVICIFAFASMFAAFLFEFKESEILYLGIFVNLSGIFGCLLFCLIEKKFDSLKTVKICLLGLLVLSSFLFFTKSVTFFWVIALLIGFFVGPIQASSRAFLSKRLRANDQLSIFSFYSIIGNVCAVLGPLLVGMIIESSESIRLGILVIPAFFFIALVPLLRLLVFEISYSSKDH